LMQSIPAVLKSFPATMFAFAGDGVLRNALEEEARSLGISSNVRFLGFRQDVLEWMSACDIFVLPSRSEGMPLVILEAMSIGKPVIATHVEGVAEVIEDGVNGYLVPPENAREIAEKIIFLLGDNKKRVQIGEAARQRVIEGYSFDRTCSLYLRLLDPE